MRSSRFAQRAAGGRRFAWVLSGRYDSNTDPVPSVPRTEFEVFLERHGGELISRSDLEQPLPPLARALNKAGRSTMSLASLVQARAGDFDAMMASGEDIGVPLALASLVSRSRVPIHMMFHGHHLDSPKLRMVAPVLRRLSHVHFHCLSAALAQRTHAVLGIPASRCHATGYGVDTRYFAGSLAAQTGIVASAGAANRDYNTLAAAVRELPVDVRIALDSTWFPPSTDLPTNGWAGNTEARSYENYERLRDLYDAAQLVVVPLHPAKHACGFAVIAEAMAMGRPIIVTRTEAPPDFVVPGVTGVFVPPNDVAALRKAICRLLEAPELAMELGRNARASMQQAHSLEKFCDRLRDAVEVSISAPVAA